MYSVTEGSVVVLEIILDMPLTVDITVTLQTNEGTATSIKLYLYRVYILGDKQNPTQAVHVSVCNATVK